MSNANTFVFNLDWYEILKKFTSELQLEVFQAIMTYASTGEAPELSPMATMGFEFIRREMDYNRRRYEETVAKRAKAGRKGAEATNSKKSKAEATQAETPVSASNAQDNTEKADTATIGQIAAPFNLCPMSAQKAEAAKGYCVVEHVGRDEFMNDFFKEENRATIDSLCSTNAIDTVTLQRLATEVLDDWQATDQPLHQDLSTAKRHLLSQIRIKLNIERRQQAASNYSYYDSEQNDRYARRRGVDPRFNRPEDYTDTI